VQPRAYKHRGLSVLPADLLLFSVRCFPFDVTHVTDGTEHAMKRLPTAADQSRQERNGNLPIAMQQERTRAA